jgi:hypothetical protein
MSGLAQLVPYTQCQYPQVLPGNILQIEQSAGVGDYIEGFNWPIPQYLQPGNMRGLGCPDCGGTCGGLGMALTSPDGYFADPMAQWGIAEWASVAAVGYMFVNSLPKMKAHASKGKKAAAKGVSMLGTLTLLGAAGLGIYFWAQANAGTGAQ